MSGPFFGGSFFGGGFFGSASAGVRGQGKGKKREVLRLREIRDRKEIGEFLREQLRLKHLPENAFVDTGAEEAKRQRKEQARQRQAEAKMRADAAAKEFQAQKAALEAEQAREREIQIYNENVKRLLILAASTQ